MRVLLVRSWAAGYGFDQSHAIGLACLAAILKEKGHSVVILDATFSNMQPQEVEAAIARSSAEVVGITAMTHEIPFVRMILTWVKAHRSNVWTILGGAHATALPVESLTEMPDLDFTIAGEGEPTMLALLDGITRRDYSFKGILGLGFRTREGTPLFSGPRTVLIDLAEMPQPAVDLYYERGYFDRHSKRPYLISCCRGCCFSCAFCSKMLGRRIRWRSPQAIVEEWARAVKDFHATRVHVVDDVFFHDSPEFDAVIRGLDREGVPQQAIFSANIHVNLVKRDVIRRAKAVGCTLINIGIESCDDYILKMANRSYTVKKAHEAVQLLKEEGLRVHCFFILGHPHETHRSLRKTLVGAIKMNPYSMGIGTMVPYPGTEVYEMAKRSEGGLQLTAADWSAYNRYGGNALAYNNISLWQLKAYQVAGYLGFYLWNLRFADMIRYFKPRLSTVLSILRPRWSHD